MTSTGRGKAISRVEVNTFAAWLLALVRRRELFVDFTSFSLFQRRVGAKSGQASETADFAPHVDDMRRALRISSRKAKARPVPSAPPTTPQLVQ